MLKKGFIKQESTEIIHDKKRFIIALILSILFAFSFYSFFNVIREAIRLFSLTDFHDIWWFSEKQNNFYNLFFASLSTVFGQSFAIQYYFDKPSFFYKKTKIRSSSVLNDQRVLNWYFLNCFSKIAFISVLIFAMAFKGGFYSLKIFPEYNFIFILIPVVLFLQSWLTLRLKFKNKVRKLMLISFLSISIISFGLSRIKYFNFSTLNETLLEKNIYATYNIKVPESEYNNPDNNYYFENIFIVKSKNSNDTMPVIIYNNKEININEFIKVGANLTSANIWQTNIWQKTHSILRLHIDKSIKMKFVNKLKCELSKNNIRKIAYQITSPETNYKVDLYSNTVLKENLWICDNSFFSFKYYYKLFKYKYKLEITQNKNGDLFIDNHYITTEDLKRKIKTTVNKSHNFATIFYINDNAEFEDYIKTYSAILDAYNTTRNEYSLAKYSKPFNKLHYDERSRIIREIPMILFNFTEDMIKEIDNYYNKNRHLNDK